MLTAEACARAPLPCWQEVHLLHRDIKPKNVFLSGTGDVRLGDFGLSKVLSGADKQAETQVGTPLYMSPELCAGKPYDRSADVWAFGCTLCVPAPCRGAARRRGVRTASNSRAALTQPSLARRLAGMRR